MDKRLIVIVGGVAGGTSAACARRLCEEREIIVFECGLHVSFANCGLPYFVGGEIVDHDTLPLQTPQTLGTRFNLDERVNIEALSIDRAAQAVNDRPWGPERPVFGTVGYVSSENTARKVDVNEYLLRYGPEERHRNEGRQRSQRTARQ